MIKKYSALILDFQRKHDNELAKVQVEAQEETLRVVSAELHDNVSQMLIVGDLKLKILKQLIPEIYKDEIDGVLSLIGRVRFDVSSMVDYFKTKPVINGGFQMAFERLLEGIKTKFNVVHSVKGKVRKMDSYIELMLFRMCQEVVSNIIKHSKAKDVYITLNYNPHFFSIIIFDNGIGFNTEGVKEAGKGIGLSNLELRAKFINAQLTVNSDINLGTEVEIMLPVPTYKSI